MTSAYRDPALENPGQLETQLWTMEAGLAELGVLVDKIRTVQTGIEQLSQRVAAVAQLDWRSPAGQAFQERAHRTRVRADELAATAGESAMLARTGVDDLQTKIATLRQQITAAKQALTNMVTGGMS